MIHPQIWEAGNDSAGYYVTVEDTSTQTTEKLIFLESTRDARKQNPEDDLRALQQFLVSSENSEESRKRKISNEQRMTHDSDACKLPRTELCGISYQFASSVSEKSFRNPDSNNILLKPSDMVFESNRLAIITPKFPNPEESHSQNEELNTPDYLGNTKNINIEQNIESNENISQKAEALYQLSDADVSTIGPSHVKNLNLDQYCWQQIKLDSNNILLKPSGIVFESNPLAIITPEFPNPEESHSQNEELNAPDYLGNTKNINIEQNIESNENISQKAEALYQLSDTDVSIIGPSHVKNQQNRATLELPAVEQPICLDCREIVSDHKEVHEGKYVYRCCRCLFMYDNFNYLQMHIYNEHINPFFCRACQMKYSVRSSHGTGGVCDVCNQDFECKYQLEEHCILVHMDYYAAKCRNCDREFDEHVVFDNTLLQEYKCCFRECKCRRKAKSKLIQHLFSHYSLKLFNCVTCGVHFQQSNALCIHLNIHHPLCGLCGKSFINGYFLAEHHCEGHT